MELQEARSLALVAPTWGGGQNFILLACEAAKTLEDAGDYELAEETLRSVWPGVGYKPALNGLDPYAKAEVLLRAGCLTRWIGRARQTENAQELSKDLVECSIEIFASLGDKEKLAEARNALAACYWSEGAFDNARAILHFLYVELNNPTSEQGLEAQLRLAMVERSEDHFSRALEILSKNQDNFNQAGSNSLKARFYNELGLIRKNLGDYDNALIDYAASGIYLEKVGNIRNCAILENNLGFLFFKVSKLDEAHAHLDRAESLFEGLADRGHIAQVKETRARVYLVQHHLTEAEKVAREAVSILEQGDERALLIEALTTHGTALARLRWFGESIAAYSRAHALAETISSDLAAQVRVTMLEELVAPVCFTSGISYDNAVHRLENKLINAALQEGNKDLRLSAMRLGLPNYQRLQYILRTTHTELLPERTEIKPRKKSIIVRTGRPPAKRDARKNNVERIADRRKREE